MRLSPSSRIPNNSARAPVVWDFSLHAKRGRPARSGHPHAPKPLQNGEAQYHQCRPPRRTLAHAQPHNSPSARSFAHNASNAFSHRSSSATTRRDSGSASPAESSGSPLCGFAVTDRLANHGTASSARHRHRLVQRFRVRRLRPASSSRRRSDSPKPTAGPSAPDTACSSAGTAPRTTDTRRASCRSVRSASAGSAATTSRRAACPLPGGNCRGGADSRHIPGSCAVPDPSGSPPSPHTPCARRR